MGNGVSINNPEGIGRRGPLTPVVADRAPTANDIENKKQGQIWVDQTNDAVYCLSSRGNWQLLGGASADVATLTGDTGGALSPTSGNININGTANQIAFAGSGSTLTASLDEALPLTATVSLTATQIKALATTQIELVAAPGAGKLVKFLNASLKLVAGSEVFTESGDNLAIKYTDDSGVAVSQTIECTGFIDQAANTYTNAEPVINAIVAATGAENAALVIDNIGSNFAGNASDDATLEISVLYRVVEI